MLGDQRHEPQGPVAQRLGDAASDRRPHEVADRPDLRPDDHRQHDAVDSDRFEEDAEGTRLARPDAEPEQNRDDHPEADHLGRASERDRERHEHRRDGEHGPRRLAAR